SISSQYVAKGENIACRSYLGTSYTNSHGCVKSDGVKPRKAV
ncbi:MAG: hypothetical protein ACI9EW_003428, partial [Cellvibrionaceae bacterium]